MCALEQQRDDQEGGLCSKDASERSGSVDFRFRRIDVVLALGVGLAALFYTGLYFDRGLDPFDEGLYAAEACRIIDGGAYGSDFLAPYGPGRYYLIAMLFTLFGSSLKVQAALFLCLRGVVAAALYLAGKRVLPRGWAVFLACAVVVAHGALHKSFFQAVVVVNLLAYYFYRSSPSLKRCLVAGAIIGAGSLFRVDAGVFAALSFGLLLSLELFLDRPKADVPLFFRKLTAFAAGALIAVLPVILGVLLSGSLGDVFAAELQRTVNVSRFAGAVEPPEYLAALDAGRIKDLLFAAMIPSGPFVFLFLCIILLVGAVRGRRNREGTLESLAVAVFGLPVLNQVKITPTFNHFLQAAPLVLMAATMILVYAARWCRQGKGRLPRAAGWFLAAAAAVPALLPVCCTLFLIRSDSVLPGTIRNRCAFQDPMAVDRAGIYWEKEKAADLRLVVREIRKGCGPDEPLFCGPFCPVVYFLADRPPAVPFVEPFYYFRNNEIQRLVIEALEERKPRFVVLEKGELHGPVVSVGGASLSRDAELVCLYIRAHYERTAGSRLFRRYEIWERK